MPSTSFCFADGEDKVVGSPVKLKDGTPIFRIGISAKLDTDENTGINTNMDLDVNQVREVMHAMQTWLNSLRPTVLS